MLAGSCRWGTFGKYQTGKPRVAKKAFKIGKICKPVCHDNKTVGAQVVKHD